MFDLHLSHRKLRIPHVLSQVTLGGASVENLCNLEGLRSDFDLMAANLDF